MISVHVVPFARDQGISLAGASLTLTAYGLGSVIGRLAAGAVSDRLGTSATIRAGYMIQIARARWRSAGASRATRVLDLARACSGSASRPPTRWSPR